MEDEILRLIAKQLTADGNLSNTSKWRIRQLARSGSFDKNAVKLIQSYMGVQSDELEKAVTTAALTEISYLDKAVQENAKKGLINGNIEVSAETSAHDAAKSYLRQAKSNLNLVNTVMRYKAKSAYINAVNSVYFETEKNRQAVLDTLGKHTASVIMGQTSLQEASRKTIAELSKKGIPAFVDKSGHEWSPEAYVTMDMRSTVANTAREAQDKRCDEYGINLIEISSHMGARPLCAPYQGRIFSRDGTSGVTTDGRGNEIKYTPLSETSFGEPAGLFGINCGHIQYPFSPGCSFQTYFPYPEEENAERYKQFQRQRYMERQIRSTKRECMMYNETGDKEAFSKASLRLSNQRTQYSEYCKETGLAQHNDRTQVYGFDRSVSSEAAWAAKRAQKTSGEGSSAVTSGSGSHAVTVNVPPTTNGGTGKIYSDVDLTNSGGSGKIKERFNTIDDPMVDLMGPAEISHQKEIEELTKHIHELGATLERPDREKLNYQPGLSPGTPGIVSISKGASYSAWLHEVKHLDDDYADGFLGFRVFENNKKCAQREIDAYQIEIDLAKSYGREDIAKKLEELRDNEIQKYR